jgi:rubrerythrin
MARDPFTNYDAWLERPYQDMYEASDRQAWLDENSEYSCEVCGYVHPASEAIDLYEQNMPLWCPACLEANGLVKKEPDFPEPWDDRDYEPDGVWDKYE